MTGISEILVLVFLICLILIVPRMMAPAASKKPRAKKAGSGLTAKMRAGIVLSVLVPVVAALICRPWSGNIIPFIITGILPVALAWGGFWILSARKN